MTPLPNTVTFAEAMEALQVEMAAALADGEPRILVQQQSSEHVLVTPPWQQP